MASSPSIIRSSIYKQFQSIDRNAYRNIIHFYESNSREIAHLEEEEHFELNIIYLRSIFEIGAYQDFLKGVDHCIQEVILKNIFLFEGEDIYYELLLRKAASLYHLRKYEESIYICRELVKINKDNPAATVLMKKVYLDDKPGFLKNARALSILLFLISAILCAVELVLISYWSSQYQETVELFRIGTFVLGFSILIGSQLFHFLRIQYRIEKLGKGKTR